MFPDLVGGTFSSREFDTVNARIQLIPTPGELDHAFELAQASIHRRLMDELTDEGVPVYYGKV